MRDRLIELINHIQDYGEKETNFTTHWRSNEHLVDYLLTNGVIVSPCKVGDVVYYLDDIVWDDECRDCEHYLIGGFGDPSECGRTRYGNKHPDCIKIIEQVVTQHDIYWWLYSNSLGKTVFLTREEAERALTERRTNND